MTLALAHQVFQAAGGAHQAPLIILHGLFGSSRNWRGLAQAFARDRDVHVLDLRNHGESPWGAEHTYDAMADDVLAYMEAAFLEEADVLGHSMGGKVAMVLALQHPERVSRLIVADIAPVSYQHDHDVIIDAMTGLDLSVVSRRSEAEAGLMHALPDLGIRKFIVQNLAIENGEARWKVNLDVIRRDFGNIVAFPDTLAGRSFSGPALFLHGGASEYVLPDHHDVIKALFPQARLQDIPEAGHWLHAEQPALFSSHVQVFLA